MDDVGGARQFPRGDLELGVCADCGFVANVASTPAAGLLGELRGDPGLLAPLPGVRPAASPAIWSTSTTCTARTVLEIGCGKGEFLVDLLRDRRQPRRRHRPRGASRSGSTARPPSGIDADRRLLPRALRRPDRRTSSSAATRSSTSPRSASSCACCGGPSAARPDAVVFFELPDVLRVLRRGRLLGHLLRALLLLHPGSLARLFRAHRLRGARPRARLRRPVHPDRGPRRRPGRRRPPLELRGDDRGAARRRRRRSKPKPRTVCADWGSELARIERRRPAGRHLGLGLEGRRVPQRDSAGAERVELRGRHQPVQARQVHGRAPGSEIVAPERLRDYKPDLVIAMNPIYLRRDPGARSTSSGSRRS